MYSAGIAKAAPITDFPLGDFDRSLQVNLVGYFLCAREFSRLMIRDGIAGRIIQINSKSGKVGSKHNPATAPPSSAAWADAVAGARSGGVRHYRAFADARQPAEVADVPAAAAAAKLGIAPDQVEQYYIDKVPLKRGCDYQDVLNTLLFYASDKASYCTGQSINITGGQVMF